MPNTIPPERFPPRLASLGFEARVINGVEVIVPPVVTVTAGEFLMGSDPKQDRIASNQPVEKPQHRVMLASFQIARYPVTFAEFDCFRRAPAQYHTPVLDWPAVNINWDWAVIYTTWLANLTGQPWRLPTEAEWEKAARGTDGRIYPWGNQWDKARANTSDSGPHRPTPVGSYPSGASPYGVQDMAGNVWEWTSSYCMSYPYKQNDGRETFRYSNTGRAVRGGYYGSPPGGVRAACRFSDGPGFGPLHAATGFRLARSVPA